MFVKISTCQICPLPVLGHLVTRHIPGPHPPNGEYPRRALRVCISGKSWGHPSLGNCRNERLLWPRRVCSTQEHWMSVTQPQKPHRGKRCALQPCAAVHLIREPLMRGAARVLCSLQVLRHLQADTALAFQGGSKR